jgi:hypothetical protein
MRWLVLLGVVSCASRGVPPPPRGEPRCWAPLPDGTRALFRVNLGSDLAPHDAQAVAYENGVVDVLVVDEAGTQTHRSQVTLEKLEHLRGLFGNPPFSTYDAERDTTIVYDGPHAGSCWLHGGARTYINSQDEAIAHFAVHFQRDLEVEEWIRSALRTRRSRDAGSPAPP